MISKRGSVNNVNCICFTLLLLVLNAKVFAGIFADAKDMITPLKAPFKMKDLKRPVFPDRKFNVVDFGGVNDGKTKNTQAFAKAIDVCNKAGGGTVFVPAGEWLTGPIHLKSNVNLNLTSNATLLFSTDPNDYLPPVFVRWAGQECMNFSPLIYANNADNIAITGNGIIDGQGKAWWHNRPGINNTVEFGKKLHKFVLDEIPVEQRVVSDLIQEGGRPQTIQPINCRNVLIEGVTIKSGPFWTIQAVYCENVIVRKLNIVNSGPNNDGVNCDSSRNMLIEQCYFSTADDGIAIKSGLNEDGWRVNRPSENIVIRDCYFNDCTFGEIAIGSEMSGGVRNVFIHDVYFNNTGMGFYIKSNLGRGGVVENVWVQDVFISNVRGNGIFIDLNYSSWFAATGGKPPTYRNIHFKNIHCGNAIRPLYINSMPQISLQNMSFENITAFTEKGICAVNARNIIFDNIMVIPKSGPVIQLRDVQNVSVLNSTIPAVLDVFVGLAGEKTSNVRLCNNDLSKVKNTTSLTAQVPVEAVIYE